MSFDKPDRIEVHSKDGCPHCASVVAFLSSQDVPFSEIKLNDQSLRETLYDRLGLVGGERTVPQVMLVADGELYRIGGEAETVLSGVESLFKSSS